jgi:hypothetical protein
LAVSTDDSSLFLGVLAARTSPHRLPTPGRLSQHCRKAHDFDRNSNFRRSNDRKYTVSKHPFHVIISVV